MIADRVKELSTSTGTGAITLTGAVTAYESFNAAFGIGPSFDYCIESVDDATGMPNGAWEIGRGHLSGATTLVRDSVQQSSNADALVAFGAGTKNVFCTLSAAAITALQAKLDDAPADGKTYGRKDAAWAEAAAKTYVDAADTLKVAKAGDTITGNITIAYDGATLNLNTTGVGASNLVFSKNGSTRWFLQTGNAESTGNIGSDLLFSAFGTGGYISAPVNINRATGNVGLTSTTASTSITTGAMTIAGGLGINGTAYSQRMSVTHSAQSRIEFNQADNSLGFLFGRSPSSDNANVLFAYDVPNGTFLFQATSASFGFSVPVVVGTPTGGAKGAGTINATAVYDDNVLLTCFGTQYAARGAVDLAQWDAVSPTGTNKLAHKFVDMLKGFDPRDPQQYIARMLEDEALPGMPTVDEWKHGGASLGEMHNRLWLATELLASAFVGLHDDYERRLGTLMQRVEALEKGRI